MQFFLVTGVWIQNMRTEKLIKSDFCLFVVDVCERTLNIFSLVIIVPSSLSSDFCVFLQLLYKRLFLFFPFSVLSIFPLFFFIRVQLHAHKLHFTSRFFNLIAHSSDNFSRQFIYTWNDISDIMYELFHLYTTHIELIFIYKMLSFSHIYSKYSTKLWRSHLNTYICDCDLCLKKDT